MFDFPAAPTAGQIFIPPGGPTYVYEAPAWKRQKGGAMVAALLATGDNPPPAPKGGNLWWESDSGETFLWYDDGSTAQWVQIASLAPGLFDAPTDGRQYARKNAAWAEVVVPPQGVPEAPADAKTYGRRNAGWSDITATLLSGYLPITGGTLTGDTSINKATPALRLNKPAAGVGAQLVGRMGGKLRWGVELGNGGAESGSDAGSDFSINRYDDAGNYLGSFSMYRASGYTLPGGDVTISKASPYVILNKNAAAQSANLYGQSANLNRWVLVLADGAAESGANAGSDLYLHRYSDAGAYLDTPLSIPRSNGYVYLARGMSFGNLSASPNVLDYYNEGTFVPTIRFGGASVGITYSHQSGYWCRVGRTITLAGRVILSNKGSSVGNASIGGLPFSVLAGTYATFACSYFNGLANPGGQPVPLLLPSGAQCELYYNTTSGVAAYANTTFSNLSDIIFGGSFQTD